MTEKKPERRGLGRGLSALMADVDIASPRETPAQAGLVAGLEIPIELVNPNPDQPRKDFSESDLEDLANSIKEHGVIQPLIVREFGPKGSYQIVAGERRWRAAQRAKLHTVPVVVRDFDDTEVLEVAIIENIQRADLNAVEEALGYRQLQDKFGHTQEQLSQALGKSRSHIANLMRMLNLPSEVLTWVREGKLSAGHARALVTSENAVEIAKQIIAKGLSVRDVERLIKAKPSLSERPRKTKAPSATKDADTKALEDDLGASLGMKVEIDHTEGQESGRISISYTDFVQLDDLCRRLAEVS